MLSAKLSPTAANPGIWVIYNNVNLVMVEEIQVATDTALTITIANKASDPGLTANAMVDRNAGGGGNIATGEAQVTALPAGLATMMTLPLAASTITLLLNGHWLAITAGWAMLVYTTQVASNVTVNMFARIIA